MDRPNAVEMREQSANSSRQLYTDTDTGAQNTERAAASSVQHQRNRTNGAGNSRRRKQYAVSTQWEQQVTEGTATKNFSNFFCCCANRIGHMYSLLEYADGTPIIVAGPCWPFCVFITVPLIVGIACLVAYFLVISSNFTLPSWILIIYVPSVAITLGFLFCVSCRDPGLMERVTDEEAGEGGWFWNEQVGSYRPPGALYCRECGVLIQEYDHLCPWTGTGIGRSNMWAFKSFVVSVNVLCYMSIGIVVWALLDGLAS